eukprot:747376-Hanusia_phi.AAC.3
MQLSCSIAGPTAALPPGHRRSGELALEGCSARAAGPGRAGHPGSDAAAAPRERSRVCAGMRKQGLLG